MSRVEFRLPDVGEGIDAAELLSWKVSVGDEVVEDQPLADVETDKAVVEIPCPATGKVSELKFEDGQRIDVGDVMAVFATAGESTSEVPQSGDHDQGSPDLDTATDLDSDLAPSSVRPTASATQQRPGGTSGASGARGRSRPLAAPATRRFARDSGIDLADIEGSGPGGRIEREDVAAAAESASLGGPTELQPARREQATEPTVVPLSGIRRTIAHRLTDAWQQVPRVVDYREVDATRLLHARTSVRDAISERGDDRLAGAMTLVPFMVKIACRALSDHPYANASIDLDAETITLHSECNIALATATPDGLMAPVIHGAQRLSLAEIASAALALNEAAQERRLRPEQLSGGTFTVNNFGGLGIWLGTPIVVPPQVANLGIGRIEDRAVVVDGEVVVKPIIPLSVSGDHRVLDGHTLAAFVSRVIELIEDPALLLEEST